MVESSKFVLGLIINPISGMGGSVGLKGTDGKTVLKKAIKLGAKPNALNRTRELLNQLEPIKSNIFFITCPGIMGAQILKEMNFEYETLNHPIFNNVEEIYDTTADHTRIAAKIMEKNETIKLLLFVGGDGTAIDIKNAGYEEKPCLGIPAGVKIYSSVFSINPSKAAFIIMQFLLDEIPLIESEVLDIDEVQFRKGKLVSKLHGYLLTPFNPDFSQSSKLSSPESDLNNQERIAKRIVESLEKDVNYLIGPGGTTKAITDNLKLKKSILGVDLLLNNKIISMDLNETQILNHIRDKKAKIIVSIIGKQGFIFGRGNLQFTPQVLKEIGPRNIIIISTKFKLQHIDNQILRIDTRDTELDEDLKGLYKIIVDYDEIRICNLE